MNLGLRKAPRVQISDERGHRPTKHCWCKKTRVIVLSCGIKIFTVHCTMWSQFTNITDKRAQRF